MVARRVTQRVVHRLEVIEVDLHHRDRLPAADLPREDVVERPPVLEPRQRVGEGLFLGGGPRGLKTPVELARGGHGGGLGLDQVEHLDRQVGRREIAAGQAVIAHRVDDPDAEAEVEHRAPPDPRQNAAKHRARRLAQAQPDRPTLGLEQRGEILGLMRPLDLEQIEERAVQPDRARLQPLERRADMGDPSLGVDPQVHRREHVAGRREVAVHQPALARSKARPSAKAVSTTCSAITSPPASRPLCSSMASAP